MIFLKALLYAISWHFGDAFRLASDQVVLEPGSNNREGIASPLKDVRDALIASQIIPTVVDDFEPTFLLDVDWKKSDALLGNTVKVKKVQKQPNFTLHLSQDQGATSTLCSSNMTYTIALTDPDAPSRSDPKWSEMCHFIATGLALSTPESDGGCSELHFSELRDVMPYKAPGPPPKTGKHRYVFLVFAPANGTTDALNPSKPNDRQHWGFEREGHGVRDWAAENELIPVGEMHRTIRFPTRSL
jgi:phosphatidylethanolamine-binding protein (PEBP) family uncharacterized protein